MPIATPFAIGSVILNILHINSARILPITPVTTITATVIVTYPPSSSDTPIPIAVVIDLGSIVTYCSCVSPIIADNTSTVKRLVTTPAAMPDTIAAKLLFKSCICSYKGIARHTVAGVSSQLKYLAPAL